MFMEKKKDKIRIRRYSCNYCNCTGFFNKKQIIFQIWNWGYQFINKDIFNRGFKLKKIDINSSFPDYIMNNKLLLKDWII